MSGKAACIGEHALVAQDIDEYPIAALGMQPVDRLCEYALIIQNTAPWAPFRSPCIFLLRAFPALSMRDFTQSPARSYP
jgi:hypothetical protein